MHAARRDRGKYREAAGAVAQAQTMWNDAVVTGVATHCYGLIQINTLPLCDCSTYYALGTSNQFSVSK
jgi:hypothetical protein